MIRYYLSAVLFAMLMSCSNTKKFHSPSSAAGGSTPVFDKQGHRGCRGLMPENTWPAMKKALDLGVTTLEMDVVFTKNKEAVLSHEPWFGHEITTKPDGTYMKDREERKFNIYWMTYDDVKTFDVGMKPHPRFPQQEKIKVVKPMLKDIFDSVKEYMMTRRKPFPFFNIETKCTPMGDKVFHPEPAEFVELLMAVIKEKGVEDYVTIQSFDFRTLQYLHEKYPSMKTSMLIEDYDKRGLNEQVKALGFTPTIYSPAFELVDEKLVKQCHQLSIKVIPWTVNDKQKIEELKKIGVDGIITDYPNLFNE